MQITCPRCGKQLPINDQLRGMKIPCDSCYTPVYVPLAGTAVTRSGKNASDSVPGSAIGSPPLPLPICNSVSPPIHPSFPAPPNPSRNTLISNNAIIITAVSCLLGLLLVVGTAMLLSRLTKVPPRPTVETVQEESRSTRERTNFQEGYSMVLPPGFKQESREETARGYIVYRYVSVEGYRFTLAIIPDESVDRFTSPPQDLSNALVKSVHELSQGVDAEVQPMHVTADGMPATVFQYYEKETFRGVTFTYFMVAMDHGRKLVAKIEGKHGGYREDDENIILPDHWYDSLLTLRHEVGFEPPLQRTRS